jgi:hypothetical protein
VVVRCNDFRDGAQFELNDDGDATQYSVSTSPRCRTVGPPWRG